MTNTQRPAKVRNPHVHTFARGYNVRDALPTTVCKHCGTGPTSIEHKKFVTAKQLEWLAAHAEEAGR
jgi:hypothetical protein